MKKGRRLFIRSGKYSRNKSPFTQTFVIGLIPWNEFKWRRRRAFGTGDQHSINHVRLLHPTSIYLLILLPLIQINTPYTLNERRKRIFPLWMRQNDERTNWASCKFQISSEELFLECQWPRRRNTQTRHCKYNECSRVYLRQTCAKNTKLNESKMSRQVPY